MLNSPNILFFLFTVTLLLLAYSLPRLSPKQTNLVFYVHDYLSGHDASAIRVSGKTGVTSNILHFGTVAVVDDLVTEGPESDSKTVGRAQGLYINSALDGMAFHMVFSVMGSSRGVLWRSKELTLFKSKEREFGVVSGTGLLSVCKRIWCDGDGVRGHGEIESYTEAQCNC